jgi:hypothetical protein
MTILSARLSSDWRCTMPQSLEPAKIKEQIARLMKSGQESELSQFVKEFQDNLQHILESLPSEYRDKVAEYQHKLADYMDDLYRNFLHKDQTAADSLSTLYTALYTIVYSDKRDEKLIAIQDLQRIAQALTGGGMVVTPPLTPPTQPDTLSQPLPQLFKLRRTS